MHVLDERVGTYRCKRKINRWPMVIFENMLDVSMFNAFVIFIELNPAWNEKAIKYRRRLFIIDAADDLVRPYIDSRKRMPRSENANMVVRSIKCLPNYPNGPSTSDRFQKLPPANKRARCQVCTSRNNPNLYTNRCDACKNHVCPEHFYKICDKCV